MQEDKIQVELLDKHRNYFDKYIPNDIYWGIGIENETYLEMGKNILTDKNFFLKQVRERYSVDYFKAFKENKYEESINKLTLPKSVPVLLNAHTFTKTDKNNDHKQIYSNLSILTLNPKFCGKTILEILEEKDSYFLDEYMKSYVFDGDTIEFVTQNFYKATIKNVIKELITNKKIFIEKLQKIFKEENIFTNFGQVDFCYNNYPFVTFMTNLGRCSIFNNMTYHFNFTLPTKLNDKGLIEDYNKFTEQHKNAIHLIQWCEPLLISIYGSEEIFSKVNNKFPNSSQRCGKSRYISIATYDSSIMKPGKILLIDSKDNHLNNNNWWFNKYYNYTDYNREDKIGLDINFHKHKNHGIEIRIFDYFNENKLEEVLTFIVLLLDYSLENNINSPVFDNNFNEYTFNIFKDKNNSLTNDIKNKYKLLFKINNDFNTNLELYNIIYKTLLEKYKNKGECYTKMVEPNINTVELVNNKKYFCC